MNMTKQLQEQAVQVYGCFPCRQIAGELRRRYITETHDGRETCPICKNPLEVFFLNLSWMSYQQGPVPVIDVSSEKVVEETPAATAS